MPSLLAIDLGLKTGLALYNGAGRLVWFRSHNYGSTERLRRHVPTILAGIPDLEVIIIEGGGNLAVVWEKEAAKRGRVIQISAEQWRKHLLFPRQQRTGLDAKRHAGETARRIIDWSGAGRPTSLRHDAAEAILIGFWGVIHVGWLAELPAGVMSAGQDVGFSISLRIR